MLIILFMLSVLFLESRQIYCILSNVSAETRCCCSAVSSLILAWRQIPCIVDTHSVGSAPQWSTKLRQWQTCSCGGCFTRKEKKRQIKLDSLFPESVPLSSPMGCCSPRGCSVSPFGGWNPCMGFELNQITCSSFWGTLSLFFFLSFSAHVDFFFFSVICHSAG